MTKFRDPVTLDRCSVQGEEEEGEEVEEEEGEEGDCPEVTSAPWAPKCASKTEEEEEEEEKMAFRKCSIASIRMERSSARMVR